MTFIIVTHFNKTSSISSEFIQAWHCLPLTKLKRSTWDTSGLGEMSITPLLSTLLPVANPSLICTVMRSNESLQGLCLMNWNHCKGETHGEFNLTRTTLPDSGRENENKKRGGRGMEEGRTSLPCFFFNIYLFWPTADCFWTHLSPSVPPQRVTCAINLNH